MKNYNTCRCCGGWSSPWGTTQLDNLPLAMAYVPFQTWGEVFDADTALKKGTLFTGLYLPFHGKR